MGLLNRFLFLTSLKAVFLLFVAISIIWGNTSGFSSMFLVFIALCFTASLKKSSPLLVELWRWTNLSMGWRRRLICPRVLMGSQYRFDICAKHFAWSLEVVCSWCLFLCEWAIRQLGLFSGLQRPWCRNFVKDIEEVYLKKSSKDRRVLLQSWDFPLTYVAKPPTFEEQAHDKEHQQRLCMHNSVKDAVAVMSWAIFMHANWCF